jgi:hypothetical protein
MKQLCNLAYAVLLENRTPAQVAELEMLLTEPVKKAELMEQQNAEAMKELQRRMPPGVGLIPPPRPPDKKDG